MLKFKRAILYIIGMLVLSAQIQAFSETPPLCAPLTSYKLNGVVNASDIAWVGAYSDGPKPLYTGMIWLLAKNKQNAIETLQNSAPFIKASGYATKVSFNGLWWWECSSDNGNYTKPTDILGIEFDSPMYNAKGELVAPRPLKLISYHALPG